MSKAESYSIGSRPVHANAKQGHFVVPSSVSSAKNVAVCGVSSTPEYAGVGTAASTRGRAVCVRRRRSARLPRLEKLCPQKGTGPDPFFPITRVLDRLNPSDSVASCTCSGTVSPLRARSIGIQFVQCPRYPANVPARDALSPGSSTIIRAR